MLRRRRRAQAYVLDHLSTHPCTDCPEADALVLEFDHVTEKTGGIAELVRDGVPIPRLAAETGRCEVVYANCHRRRTTIRARSFGFTRDAAAIAEARPRRARNLLYLMEILDLAACHDCGVADPVVLEFDHVRAKHSPVASLAWFESSLTVLQREVDACEIRCRNCHRKRTARTGGHYRHLAKQITNPQGVGPLGFEPRPPA